LISSMNTIAGRPAGAADDEIDQAADQQQRQEPGQY
jgi:hypothetical protein